jgi:putative ABC transport system substrate-binding protein
VTASALSVVHRELIITVAARHKLPAVYYRRLYVTSGGLISYGPTSSTSSDVLPAMSALLR